MWIVIPRSSLHYQKHAIKGLLICVFCVVLAILPGLIIFGSDLNFDYQPTIKSAFLAISRGLNWLPNLYSNSVNIGWYYGAIIFSLTCVGIYLTIKERNKLMISL
ncbi:unnamed protein product, partial [marine sediment metagenome]